MQGRHSPQALGDDDGGTQRMEKTTLCKEIMVVRDTRRVTMTQYKEMVT